MPTTAITTTSGTTFKSQFGDKLGGGSGELVLLPYADFGLSSLGTGFLQGLADVLPLVTYKENGSSFLQLDTPGVAGYDIRGDIYGEVGFGAKLKYELDIGQVGVAATITSAIAGEDVYREATASEGGSFFAAANGRMDIFDAYTINTELARIVIDVKGAGPTKASYLDLILEYDYQIGVGRLGVYDDGVETGWGIGDSLLLTTDPAGESDDAPEQIPIRLLTIDPNDPGASFNIPGVTGKVSVPKLPDLALSAGGTGYEAFTAGSASGDGDPFATITVDPIAFIPIIKDINKGSYFFLQTPLIDAGIEWQLLRADMTLGAQLNQSLTAEIADVQIKAEVRERRDNYTTIVDSAAGKLGDRLILDGFTPGSQWDTHIDETYTIKVKITSDIDLKLFFQLDLGLLHLEAIINPILIDEKRFGFDLFSKGFKYDLASIDLVPGGNVFYVNLEPIVVQTRVDTFVPLVGTPGNDTVTKTGEDALPPGQTAYNGYGGDDIVNGNNLANLLEGGEGNDELYGSGSFKADAENALYGGSGWDTIDGGVANDRIYAGEGGEFGTGKEFIRGLNGNDVIVGGTGDGDYDGGNADDEIYLTIRDGVNQTAIGGPGYDLLGIDYTPVSEGVELDLATAQNGGGIILSWTGNSFTGGNTFETFIVRGSTFADTLSGTGIADDLNGGAGDDVIDARDGADKVSGGVGDDELFGRGGNDTLNGDEGDDEIHASAGDDIVKGGAGNDKVFAGSGLDEVEGGAGRDVIYDESFDSSSDEFYGGDGDDLLFGGGGYDTLRGEGGDDRLTANFDGSLLVGGAGRDTLRANANSVLFGGAGSDTYDLGISPDGVRLYDDDPLEEAFLPDSGLAVDRLTATGIFTSVSAPPPGYDVPTERSLSFFYAGAAVSRLFFAADRAPGQYRGIDAFTVTGTAGAESFVIVNSLAADVLKGEAGDDVLDGGEGGADDLQGGDGADEIVADALDRVDGGAGFDTLYWRPGNAGEKLTIGDGQSRGGVGYIERGTGPTGLPIVDIERLVMIGSGDGRDSITGGAFVDILDGGKGKDELAGMGGDDRLVGGSEGDRLSGGDGDDYLDLRDASGTGATFVNVRPIDGRIFKEQIGLDYADGGEGNDLIEASSTAKLIDGGSGDDAVIMSVGGNRGNIVTRIELGDGNDAALGSSEAEFIVGGYDARLVDLSALGRLSVAERDAIVSDAPGLDDDIIFAEGGNDIVHGGRGQDTIDAGTGFDKVYGGTGDDSLTGDGSDQISGDAGDDTLFRSGGTGEGSARGARLLLDGGEGVDTAFFVYTGRVSALNVALTPDTLVGTDLRLVAVERINATLGDGADRATGGALDDVIAGGAGADILRGGEGADTLYGRLKIASAPVAGRPIVDQLFGDGGDDRIVVDAAASAFGGLGVDTLEVRGLNAQITGSTFVVQAAGVMGPISYQQMDRLDYIADVDGPAVLLIGGVGADRMTGTNSNDSLVGGGGDDQLFGGSGDDLLAVRDVVTLATLDGGAGVDTATIDMSASLRNIRVSLQGRYELPDVRGGIFSPVTLTGIEKLVAITGGGIDQVVGGAGADRIHTGAGADFVDPGSGSDIVELGEGNDVLVDRAANPVFEYFYGQGGDDRISTGNNRVYVSGGEGNDVITVTESFIDNALFDTPDLIEGDAGDDVITTNSVGRFFGGTGNDRITTDVSKAGAQSIDLVAGGTYDVRSNWRISGFEEYFLTFGAGDEDISVTYGLHNLVGGAGFDRVEVRADTPVNFTMFEISGRGKVYEFENGMVLSGFEEVTFRYTPVTRTGTAGDDQLEGSFGDDFLYGLNGADLLDGKQGADQMFGGAGNDVYVVDIGGDVVVENANEGRDKILLYDTLTFITPANVEDVDVMVAAGGFVRGNDLNNLINGGAGPDDLFGGQGDDELNGLAGDDVLNGGFGIDILRGGPGNDSYAQDGPDTLIELAGEGIDTVRFFGSYTLPDQIENLVLEGAFASNGTGNAASNTITGNGGANELRGLDGSDRLLGVGGNDLLIGGPGIDQLTGGTGADRFRFDTVSESLLDRVQDFDSGVDRIELSAIDADVTVRGNQSFSFIGSAAFTNVAGQLRVTANGGLWQIEGDTDGNGTSELLFYVVGEQPLAGDFFL